MRMKHKAVSFEDDVFFSSHTHTSTKEGKGERTMAEFSHPHLIAACQNCKRVAFLASTHCKSCGQERSNCKAAAAAALFLRLMGRTQRLLHISSKSPKHGRFTDVERKYYSVLTAYRAFISYIELMNVSHCFRGMHPHYKSYGRYGAHARQVVAEKWDMFCTLKKDVPAIWDMFADLNQYMVERTSQWAFTLQDFPVRDFEDLMRPTSIHEIALFIVLGRYGESVWDEMMHNDIFLQNIHRCSPYAVMIAVMQSPRLHTDKMKSEDLIKYLRLFFTGQGYDIKPAMAWLTNEYEPARSDPDLILFRYEVLLRLRKNDFDETKDASHLVKADPPYRDVYDEIERCADTLKTKLNNDQWDELEYLMLPGLCPKDPGTNDDICKLASSSMTLFQQMSRLFIG